MRGQEIRKFDMLRRVQQFLDGAVATLGAVNASAARKELDRLVADMGANESTQATSMLKAKSETASQLALRRDLVTHHMRPIATIAAAHLRDVPAFKALRPPPKGVKVAVLIQQATAMAGAARAYAPVFVENGLPEDFADALLAAAEAVRGSIDARAGYIASRAGARGGLKATASRAHLILRLLDAQVQSAFLDDPKALAGWKSAKRIGRGKVVSMEATATARDATTDACLSRTTSRHALGVALLAHATPHGGKRAPTPALTSASRRRIVRACSASTP